MPHKSSDAGKLMTKLLARFYDLHFETGGSVSNIDKSFGLGKDYDFGYSASGRSSSHFHGKKQMQYPTFKQYYTKLKKSYGRRIRNGVRLLNILITIESNLGLDKEITLLKQSTSNSCREMIKLMLSDTDLKTIVSINAKAFSTLPEFGFIASSIVATRALNVFGISAADTANKLIFGAYTFECIVTELNLVSEEFHAFLVKYVFPPISTTSQILPSVRYDKYEYDNHIAFIAQLLKTFDKFIDNKPSVVKNEFILRLCFADVDELLSDIEWEMGVIDASDKKTEFGLHFVFTEMKIDFQPTYRLERAAA